MSSQGTANTLRSSEKKRVRFKQETEIREFESHGQSKKARVAIALDAMESLEGEISAVNIKSSEIQPNSHHRRRPISAVTRDLFSGDGEEEEAEEEREIEGTESTDWDVFQADAEIDYDEPEQLLNDAGIPIEPFNLKEERDHGYFDPVSGSYIQLKKKEDVEDAWADALATTEVDPGWSQSVIDRASAREVKARRKSGGSGGGGGGEQSNESISKDLSAEDIIIIKQKIVSLLHPGENVLAALRRLGRERAPERKNSSSSSLLEKKPPPLIKRASLTPQAELEFDQLTDWSSVLMEAGEFLIHGETREELLKRLNAEKGSNNKNDTEKGGCDGEERRTVEKTSTIGVAVEKEDMDMFAAEDDIEGTKTDKLMEKEEKETAQTLQPPFLPQLVPPLQQPPPLVEDNEHLAPSFLQGFILDESSGYYYNSSLGAYYDPASSLFGDAASGRWYRIDENTGQYILV